MNKSITIFATLGILALLSGCNRSTSVAKDLTPNMRGVSQTNVEFDASEAVVINVGDRLYQDDWRNFMLLNKPSSLSVVPVVQD